ncbi:MAG: hypothetical protein K1W23_07485 [Lachnospiraceae bacterium]
MPGKIRDRIRMIISGGDRGKGRPAKETMLIIFLSGILIFVILLPTGNNAGSYVSRKNQKTERTDAAASMQTGGNEKNETSADEYRRGLERELEEFLSSVAGVGEVKVLIYMKNSQEYIVEKDIPVSNSVNGEGSELRKEEATVYTTDESGNEVPFIAQTRRPEIGGVVISAKGAANEAVRLQIVRLVMALYGVEANKVEVLQMG